MPEPNRYFVKKSNWTDQEIVDADKSEGAYTFIPEWFDQAPRQFSNLNDDITYQSGQLVEQWSLFFKNCTTGEKAILRVRFSPLW